MKRGSDAMSKNFWGVKVLRPVNLRTTTVMSWSDICQVNRFVSQAGAEAADFRWRIDNRPTRTEYPNYGNQAH